MTLSRQANEFIAVGKFLEPKEAQIAKGVLEAAGIECLLQDEWANNMLALSSRARIKVRQRDEEEALELLKVTEGETSLPPGGFDA